MMQVRAQQADDSSLVPAAILEATIVPWILQNEKALERPGFHLLMRAFKALDAEDEGWVNADQLKALLITKARRLIHGCTFAWLQPILAVHSHG